MLLLILVPPLPLRGLIDLAGTLAITAGVVFIIYGVFSLGKVSSRRRLADRLAWAVCVYAITPCSGSAELPYHYVNRSSCTTTVASHCNTAPSGALPS